MPEEAAQVADELAFEHVEVFTHEPRWFLERLRNYGALFLGAATAVAYDDKTIGTNQMVLRNLSTHRPAVNRDPPAVGRITHQERDPEASGLIGEVCSPVPDRELRGPRPHLRPACRTVPHDRGVTAIVGAPAPAAPW